MLVGVAERGVFLARRRRVSALAPTRLPSAAEVASARERLSRPGAGDLQRPVRTGPGERLQPVGTQPDERLQPVATQPGDRLQPVGRGGFVSRVSTASYDATTRTLHGTSAAGRQSTLVLDDRGRPVQAQASDLTSISYAYDTRGRAAQGSRESKGFCAEHPMHSVGDGWPADVAWALQQ